MIPMIYLVIWRCDGFWMWMFEWMQNVHIFTAALYSSFIEWNVHAKMSHAMIYRNGLSRWRIWRFISILSIEPIFFLLFSSSSALLQFLSYIFVCFFFSVEIHQIVWLFIDCQRQKICPHKNHQSTAIVKFLLSITINTTPAMKIKINSQKNRTKRKYCTIYKVKCSFRIVVLTLDFMRKMTTIFKIYDIPHLLFHVIGIFNKL